MHGSVHKLHLLHTMEELRSAVVLDASDSLQLLFATQKVRIFIWFLILNMGNINCKMKENLNFYSNYNLMLIRKFSLKMFKFNNFRENYLIVWTNLITKRCTTYPNSTFKEIYLAIYGGKGTKSERALQRMDTIEIRERESRRQRKLTMGLEK